jgi:HK97 family phage major capsid protein
VEYSSTPASAEVGIVAKALLHASGGMRSDAAIIAKAGGAGPRVVRILQKGAIGASSLGDDDSGEILADWRIASGAFFSSLRTQSVFFRLLDSGMRRVPLRTRLGVVSLDASAYVVGEGAAVPISKLTLSQPSLEPTQAAIIIIVTSEVAEHLSAAASHVVNAEMRAALAETVDTEFFNLLIDSNTPTFTSSGNTADDMRADLLELLDAVNTKGGTLVWAAAPDVANRLALISDPRGAMSPVGGELLGLPAMVSSAVPSGTLRLLNADRIVGNTESLLLDSSREASLEMSDTPTGNAAVPTAAEAVSLFQSNSVALRARIRFAAERTADNAIAELEDINWMAAASA